MNLKNIVSSIALSTVLLISCLGLPIVCSAQTGAITGTVTSNPEGGGVALQGLWVSAFQYHTENYMGSVETNSSGVYTFENLENGSYRLEVEGGIVGGSHYAGEYYDDTYVRSEAAEVVVSGGGTTTGIDFSLAPGGTITGTVTSDPQWGSIPLEGFVVDAVEYSTYEWAGGCQTDASGFYSITTLPGSYILDAENGGGYVKEYYNNAYHWDQATQVVVTQDQTTSGIDFSLGKRAGGGSLLLLLSLLKKSFW
jgi:hypothetical protein